VDGHDLIAITRTEREHGTQLLFDPATGRCSGRVSLYFGVDGPGVARDNIMSWSVWQQEMVSRDDVP
jgi:hypothetical protein